MLISQIKGHERSLNQQNRAAKGAGVLFFAILVGLAATTGIGQDPPATPGLGNQIQHQTHTTQTGFPPARTSGIAAPAEGLSAVSATKPRGLDSAQTPGMSLARVGAANDMIGFSHSDASGTQTITLVHTGKSWIAVYHIDRSGKIHLVSSRPIDADFSLQLNATSPLPEEIREIGRR